MENKETALTLPQSLQLGEILYKSGYFTDVKSAMQATVKVLRGQELGLGPVTALEQIHVVQGKTALSAGLIGAMIKRSNKYDYHVSKLDSDTCELVFYENGKEIGMSAFTIKDAEKAGLSEKNLWRQYPRNMLLARALSNGARWYCPDVFGSAIYTPEELQTIDVEVIPAQAAKEQKVQKKAKEDDREKKLTQEKQWVGVGGVPARPEINVALNALDRQAREKAEEAVREEKLTQAAVQSEKEWQQLMKEQGIGQSAEELAAEADPDYDGIDHKLAVAWAVLGTPIAKQNAVLKKPGLDKQALLAQLQEEIEIRRRTPSETI